MNGILQKEEDKGKTQALTLDHLRTAFGLLVVGLTLASLLFVLEKVLHFKNK